MGSLRVIQYITTFSDRYPKGTPIGVINTTRVVDLHNRLFESHTVIARVRSVGNDPGVLLSATVEERMKGEGEDALLIHYVTKKFLYSNKRWDLSESQSFRIGSAAES